MAEKKEYKKPQFIVVEPEEDGGARYRLPYGIAKGLGLDTDGMTPRQVWDMLKGRGIDPEKAYDELEKKAKTEVKKEQPKEVDAQTEVYKKTITQSKAFNTIKKNKEKVEKDFNNRLSSEQLSIVSKYIDKLYEFTDGSGLYGGSATYIKYPQGSVGSKLDQELGFDFEATTFYHEYGHFVDNIVSREKGNFVWTYDSDTTNVDEDALNSFNEILKEGGGDKPIKDFKRLERGQVQAFYKGLAKLTGKDQIWGPKGRKEFGYINEPYKPTYTPERNRQLFGEYAYEHSKLQWEQYYKDYEMWQKAEKNGDNAAAIKRQEEYNKKAEEHNRPYEAQLQRWVIVTDFFGLYTNNRIDPYNNGYRGHRATYNKTMNAQTETWAEYFSFKMTNDTKGLDIMKKYLPKTYEAFEQKYNALKETKNG